MMEQEQRPPLTPQEAIAQIGYLRALVDETRARLDGWDVPLMAWGGAWIVGYLVRAWSLAPFSSELAPSRQLVVLVWLVSLGAAGAVHIVKSRTMTKYRSVPPLARRLFVTSMVLFAAVGIGPHLMGGMGGRAWNAYWPFWIGIIYGVNGIFIGTELIVIGAWLILASVVSLLMPQWLQCAWLALAAGGGLVVTGVVVRRRFGGKPLAP